MAKRRDIRKIWRYGSGYNKGAYGVILPKEWVEKYRVEFVKIKETPEGLLLVPMLPIDEVSREGD